MFVYGVFMYEELISQLLGKKKTLLPATLADHQRYNLDMQDWPKIPVVVPEPGACVEGCVLLDIDAKSLSILDDFEDAGIGLYRRMTTPVRLVDGRELEVFVYIGTELVQDALSGIWCEQDFMRTHFSEYRDEIIPDYLQERASAEP